ncbi:hypothetical protein [Edaphobacter albus]|uniref:hypothetical protein n=1 Tax=Edaphobacter sp. 4G125 TaxID=2763071 RepID=UPI0016453CA9|nr:hypothetical protein [Edaphobacter sp. 4G125]QNI37513.1 hypothetical protein H7846_04205 [Edaphobacter sp. 4G125]
MKERFMDDKGLDVMTLDMVFPNGMWRDVDARTTADSPRPMIVANLIEKLKELPQDAECWIDVDGFGEGSLPDPQLRVDGKVWL